MRKLHCCKAAWCSWHVVLRLLLGALPHKHGRRQADSLGGAGSGPPTTGTASLDSHGSNSFLSPSNTVVAYWCSVARTWAAAAHRAPRSRAWTPSTVTSSTSRPPTSTAVSLSMAAPSAGEAFGRAGAYCAGGRSRHAAVFFALVAALECWQAFGVWGGCSASVWDMPMAPPVAAHQRRLRRFLTTDTCRLQFVPHVVRVRIGCSIRRIVHR